MKRWVLAVVAVLAMAACGEGEDRPGDASASGSGSGSGSASGSASGAHHEEEDTEPAFEEADATTSVDVTLQDYAFVGIPESVQGPNVLFDASVKAGEHELEILDADGEAVGELHQFGPGKEKHLAVKLEPGTYSAVCLVEEGSKTHEELGMKTTFTVT